MKKEHIGLIVGGLLLFGYLLDAVANPLPHRFPTPYHFFTPASLTLYPFTTTSVVIKALGLFLGTTWLISLTGLQRQVKGVILFMVSALVQFYSLQDVASRAFVLPLEWSLSMTLAGALLLIPMVFYFVAGFFGGFFKSTSSTS